MKDKLNRLYGTDYKNQYERLKNDVNDRLKFLIKNFPLIINDDHINNKITLDAKIDLLINIENIIKERYNNHEQKNLFTDL